MASILYNQLKQDLLSGAMDLSAGGDTVKVALFTATYSPAATDTAYGSGNLASNETTNTSGSGYTAGGAALTAANNSILTAGAPTIAWTNTSNTSSVSWTSSSFTAAYAVLYNSTVSNHAMCCIDFGGAKTVSSGTFTITWNASGIFGLA